jgi:hypothetical protein
MRAVEIPCDLERADNTLGGTRGFSDRLTVRTHLCPTGHVPLTRDSYNVLYHLARFAGLRPAADTAA